MTPAVRLEAKEGMGWVLEENEEGKTEAGKGNSQEMEIRIGCLGSRDSQKLHPFLMTQGK